MAMPVQVRVTALRTPDEAALGRPMWLAFRGSADDEYGGPADAEGTLRALWRAGGGTVLSGRLARQQSWSLCWLRL